jgi:hypothetical protein
MLQIFDLGSILGEGTGALKAYAALKRPSPNPLPKGEGSTP